MLAALSALRCCLQNDGCLSCKACYSFDFSTVGLLTCRLNGSQVFSYVGLSPVEVGSDTALNFLATPLQRAAQQLNGRPKPEKSCYPGTIPRKTVLLGHICPVSRLSTLPIKAKTSTTKNGVSRAVFTIPAHFVTRRCLAPQDAVPAQQPRTT